MGQQRLLDQPPGEAEVRSAAQANGCELMGIQSTNWPDDSYRTPASYDDAKVVYDAACTPAGALEPRRVTYEAQFGAAVRTNTGDSQPFWELRLNQPVKGAAAPTDAPHAMADNNSQTSQSSETSPSSGELSGELSDGPACNALLKTVASQVIPCVQDIDARAAARIQSWLDVTAQASRIPSGSANKDFAAVRIDEACLGSWQTGMARDFQGSSPFAACAPQ
ncbi:hypothetical protein [Hydrogenophaga sp. 5NK40-0174]|uniref:hypothetical protein n=1 Tax=Hydrogenophaga sp. 5NK40-0174 TaxID=3127649 RepID=UPI003104E18E